MSVSDTKSLRTSVILGRTSGAEDHFAQLFVAMTGNSRDGLIRSCQLTTKSNFENT